MAQNKTRATGASVDDYIAARANEQQHADATHLIGLLGQITGEPPTMWGPSIVGFGRYRYTYESGRSGEAPLTGFAIRGRELVVYVIAEGDAQKLLKKLGRHRIGKSCLYFKCLSDLDLSVLRELVTCSVTNVKQRYESDSAVAGV